MITKGKWDWKDGIQLVVGPAGDPEGDPIAIIVNHPSEAFSNAQALSALPDLIEALMMLYEETADYIRINHLGDVHHNQSMKCSKAALEKAGVL